MCWTKCGGSAVGDVDRYWSGEKNRRSNISQCILITYYATYIVSVLTETGL